MKEYYFEIDIKWSQWGIEEETEQEARAKLKATFYEQFGIDLADAEITKSEEV